MNLKVEYSSVPTVFQAHHILLKLAFLFFSGKPEEGGGGKGEEVAFADTTRACFNFQLGTFSGRDSVNLFIQAFS